MKVAKIRQLTRITWSIGRQEPRISGQVATYSYRLTEIDRADSYEKSNAFANLTARYDNDVAFLGTL